MISREGASEKTNRPNLTTLNLSSNNISDEAATVLSKNVSWKNLTVLSLGEYVSDEEARDLLRKRCQLSNYESNEIYLIVVYRSIEIYFYCPSDFKMKNSSFKFAFITKVVEIV